jgi:hypothetical protein
MKLSPVGMVVIWFSAITVSIAWMVSSTESGFVGR